MAKRASILKQPNNISYFEDVYKLQKEYQSSLIQNIDSKNFVWIGEHELCYTLGRGSSLSNFNGIINENNFKVFRIDRGGEITCHMPGQIVVYLVLDLRNYKKDLNWYLRTLEDVIIKILSKFDIYGEKKDGFTGVWCQNKKIASIGIGCKKWITLHGFSLNVSSDLDKFAKIVPCGIDGCLMTNMKDLNKRINIKEVKKIVKKTIQQEFNLNFVREYS